MKPGELPKPKLCPVCGDELKHDIQIVFVLKKNTMHDPWSYTRPGAPVSRWRGYPRFRRKLKRTIYVCARCRIKVVLHRDRRARTRK